MRRLIDKTRPRSYAEIRKLVRTGDLLFWTPTNSAARLIAQLTDGPFSHVGSASWAGDVLESHEQLQFHGGRTCNLSALVRQYPGAIHVHRIRGLRGYDFSQWQRRRAGEPYGWRDLCGSALRRLTNDAIRAPSRKRLAEVSQRTEPELWARLNSVPAMAAAFCSEAVISDLRAVGFDCLPGLAAWEVSPNAIAELAEYQFTLVP